MSVHSHLHLHLHLHSHHYRRRCQSTEHSFPNFKQFDALTVNKLPPVNKKNIKPMLYCMSFPAKLQWYSVILPTSRKHLILLPCCFSPDSWLCYFQVLWIQSCGKLVHNTLNLDSSNPVQISMQYCKLYFKGTFGI